MSSTKVMQDGKLNQVEYNLQAAFAYSHRSLETSILAL